MTYTTSLSTLIFKKKTFIPGLFVADCTLWQRMSLADGINYIKDNCSKATLKVFRAFMEHKTRHDHLYPSHALLAKMANVSVATVKRAIEKLKSLGVLYKAWQSYGACHYYLNSALFEPEFLKQLKAFFINFRLALFSALLLVPKEPKKNCLKPDELLLILKEDNLKNYLIGKGALATPALKDVVKKEEFVMESEVYRGMERFKTHKGTNVPKPSTKPAGKWETLDERFERKKRNLIERGIDITGMMKYQILNYDQDIEAEENKKIFQQQQELLKSRK